MDQKLLVCSRGDASEMCFISSLLNNMLHRSFEQSSLLAQQPLALRSLHRFPFRVDRIAFGFFVLPAPAPLIASTPAFRIRLLEAHLHSCSSGSLVAVTSVGFLTRFDVFFVGLLSGLLYVLVGVCECFFIVCVPCAPCLVMMKESLVEIDGVLVLVGDRVLPFFIFMIRCRWYGLLILLEPSSASYGRVSQAARVGVSILDSLANVGDP